MICILKHNEAAKAQLKELTELLATENGKVDVDNMDYYESMAYHMLCCNNGYALRLDPCGNDSKLYNYLLENVTHGDVKAAIILKSQIYTKPFIAKHGDWLNENKPEPTIDKLEIQASGSSLSNIFKNITTEELNDFLYTLLQNNILSSSSIANSVVNSPTNNPIIKDRSMWIQKQLVSEQVKKEIEKQADLLHAKHPDVSKNDWIAEINQTVAYDLRSLYNREKINQLLEDVKKLLCSAWNILLNDQGIAVNNLQKDNYNSTTKIGKFFHKLNSEYDPYWIQEYRCNIINTITSKAEDVRLTSVIIEILNAFLLNKNARDISVAAMKAYFKMFKDTPLVKNCIIESGKIKKNSKGEVTKQSLYEAIADIEKQLENEVLFYSQTSDSKSFKTFVRNFFQKLKNALLCVSFFVSNVDTKITHNLISASAAAGITLAVGGSLPLSVAAWIATKIGAKITNKVLIDLYGSSYNSYGKYHDALREILIAQSLNADLLQLDENDVRNDDVMTEMLNTLNDTIRCKGGRVNLTLIRLKRNLISLIKSLRSVAEQGSSRANQIHKLEELLDFCQEAIKSESNRRLENILRFITSYCNTADDSLSAVYAKLMQWKTDMDNGNFSTVNVHELMRFKTDVIGAYFKSINCGLCKTFDGFALEGIRFENEMNALIKFTIATKINNTKSLFGEVLNQYLTNYVHSALQETAARTVTREKAQTLENNMIHWMNNEINNGNVSVISRYIAPARDNLSPLVRLISQKLEEIETNVTLEVDPIANELEDIRVSIRNSSDRLFFNQMNKYCERDEEGLFTGNFLSSVNYGQYIKDLRNEIDFLVKKYDLLRNDRKAILWDDVEEDKWVAYNTDLCLWMAGADRDEKGNYAITDESGKYKTDNNGNIIISKTHLDSNGNVDFKKVIPRIHRRFYYQYYIDKATILGKEATDELASLNQQIASIYDRCMTEIVVDGKKLRIPIIAKLNPDLRVRLQSALMRKSLLSSLYYVDDDKNTHTYITSINRKQGRDLELSNRFFLWNQKKRTYYNDVEHPQYKLYNAVLKDYDEKIQKASSQDEKNKLEAEKLLFEKDSTKYQLKDSFLDLFLRSRNNEYDLSDDKTREYLSILSVFATINKKIMSSNSKRTPDLKRIGNPSIDGNVASMWDQLTRMDAKLRLLATELKIIEQTDEDSTNKLNSIKTYLTLVYVPLLNDDESETNKSFVKYLTTDPNGPMLDKQILMFAGKMGFEYCSLLKRSEANQQVLGLKRVVDGHKVNLYGSIDEVYENKPTGIFSESQSIMSDEGYDSSESNYILVNQLYKRYDNSEKYNKIKNDELYKKMLEIMDKSWANYAGFTRKNRFQLPQREAKVSALYGRAFMQLGNTFAGLKDASKFVWSDLTDFTTRDEYFEDTITRADGTTVELVPSRFISSLDNSNRIDTDLISSIIDFYTESVRYKYRSKIAPYMEAMYFLLCGGYNSTPDAANRFQADTIRGEINKTVYGRNITGSGENGRITSDERIYAKGSKLFRSILHKRLMSHNFLSVLKNGYDSFCNLLQATFTGKYIMAQNVLHGIGRMIYDKENNVFALGTQVLSINRSKATNMTLALMHLNGAGKNIHERFEDQYKWWVRRLLNSSSSIEFEFVDYTVKGIITESVYDMYRLMWNPITNKYEFMNENEAELAYLSSSTREAGYEAWNNSHTTLRDVYYFDKVDGTAKLKEQIDFEGKKFEVIDLVRPKSDISISDDNRSRVLETKIKTTIRQLSSTINGMLDEADKNQLERNYAGALLVAFRGWMVSQSGEFYKDGRDFYDYEQDIDTGTTLTKYLKKLNSLTEDVLRQGGLDSYNYDGLYNFATGTIDRGLHKDLFVNLTHHVVDFAEMLLIVPEMVGNAKNRHTERMSIELFHQLRNFAMAVDLFAMTIILTALAFSWYNDDDDDSETKKVLKSLIYTTFIASISERFTQLGAAPFLLSASDIINAATVGTVLIDDMHFLYDAAIDLLSMIENGFRNESAEDVETFNYLINGSFKGKKTWLKNITKASALLNIDTLPILLALDGISKYTFDKNDKIKFTDYNLNVYKNTTVLGNIGRAKWYSDLVPTRWFSQMWNKKFPDRPLTQIKSNKNKKKSVIVVQ